MRSKLRGITIAYDDFGPVKASAEGRTLVLVHGHPLDRSMWRPQIEAVVSAGWRVVIPDLRGYGETTVVPGTTGLDVFADDLAALLDALGVGRAVVGGLSMGGQIAMEFARLHGHRLQGLVLAATFPRSDTEETKSLRRRTATRLDGEGIAAMAALADELLPRMLAEQAIVQHPEIAERVRAMMRAAPPAGGAAALRGRAERPAYEELLRQLRIPALIVVGDQDAYTSRHDAEQMRDLLGFGRLLWLPGIGHLPNLESSGEFNQALVAFLEDVANAA